MTCFFHVYVHSRFTTDREVFVPYTCRLLPSPPIVKCYFHLHVNSRFTSDRYEWSSLFVAIPSRCLSNVANCSQFNAQGYDGDLRPRVGKNKKSQGDTSTGVISCRKGVKRNRSSGGGASQSSSHPSLDAEGENLINASKNKGRKRKNGGCCNARLVVTIGRLTKTGDDRWFVSVRDGVHTGHPVVTCSLLAKPMRLLDSAELEIAADALSSHSGSGIARALFFYRTGDLIHRNVLRRLTRLRDNASMGLLPTDQVSEG